MGLITIWWVCEISFSFCYYNFEAPFHFSHSPFTLGNHGNPREVAVQLDHVEIIKIIDSTTKDQSEMLLKKSVDCFSSFYGQQEIRSLEKKKEEVAALISSAEKGPGDWDVGGLWVFVDFACGFCELSKIFLLRLTFLSSLPHLPHFRHLPRHIWICL